MSNKRAAILTINARAHSLWRGRLRGHCCWRFTIEPNATAAREKGTGGGSVTGDEELSVVAETETASQGGGGGGGILQRTLGQI